MAQPTQEFPPWLSPAVATVTDAAGIVATETSIVYVAPTYFGPSIPLGSLYSFGGSTEPATIFLPGMTTTTIATPSTTATPSLTTTLTTNATPTTSVSTTAITTSPTITSATPTTSSSAVSSTTSVSSSSSTISSSSLTLSSTSGSSPSSTLSSNPSSTATLGSGPAAMAGLTKGQLVGVIVASILGLIFLFVLALFLYLWCRGRRNRRNHQALSGLDDDYYFVPPGGRLPGEGSPRHSGEEQDPFLQHSSTGAGAGGWTGQSSTAGRSEMGPGGTAAASAAGAGIVGATMMTQVPGSHSATRASVTRVPPPTTGSNSSGSTASHASGFGVLLDRPSLGVQLPSTSEREEQGASTSRPLSDMDMRRIGRESVLPDEYDQYPDEEYTGAYAYSQDPNVRAPRLVGASMPLLSQDEDQMPFSSTPSPGRDLVHQPSLEESAMLLTARRVKVEDLGPRTPPQVSPTNSGSSNGAYPAPRASGGFLGGLGLGGLANIGRMSWFKGSESPRPSEQDFTIEPFISENPHHDLETGPSAVPRTGSRQLLSPTDAMDSFGQRTGTYGVGPDGTRPHSSVSARSGASGNTLYHDAVESASSIPSTPLLAPPPRALTPADALSEHAWLASPFGASALLSRSNSPPDYDEGPSSGTSPMQSPTGTSFGYDTTLPTDILDMPAPTALNHFASISSIKETATGSSVGAYKPAPFPPPGLETIRPICVGLGHGGGAGWAEGTGGNASPTSSFGVGLSMAEAMMGDERHGAGISIDVLEEAPPDAEQGWRSMASSNTAMLHEPANRGTFGTYVPAFGTIMSEQGSLHSMRSHFTPSTRSTGSAPLSRRDLNTSATGSLNSATSSARFSAHSSSLIPRSQGASSSGHHSNTAAAQTLVRHGSLTNEDRRRGVSPALSAFGHQSRHANANASNQSGTSTPSSINHLSSPSPAHIVGGLLEKRGSPMHRTTDSMSMMDTSFETVRAVQPARSLSPLSANFPLSAPWAGGLENDWQASV